MSRRFAAPFPRKIVTPDSDPGRESLVFRFAEAETDARVRGHGVARGLAR